jgi:hypothetical protein
MGFWRAGKKWRGFRGGNFLPASREVSLPAAERRAGNSVSLDFVFYIYESNSAKQFQKFEDFLS